MQLFKPAYAFDYHSFPTNLVPIVFSSIGQKQGGVRALGASIVTALKFESRTCTLSLTELVLHFGLALRSEGHYYNVGSSLYALTPASSGLHWLNEGGSC